MPRSKPKTSQPRPQALQGWKAAIHEYVKLSNQSEFEYRSSHFAPLVTDTDHLARLEGKLLRLQEREQSRQAAAVKIESKAELVRVHEAGREVSVLLRIGSKKTMQQQGSVYIEDRCEYERVWGQDQGGRWRIVRVEPIVAERRPQFGLSPSGQDDQYLDPPYGARLFPKQQSAPYLNYDILTDFKHRRAGISYRRDLAAAYADLWWDKPNPAYEEFEVNCTNYVSQCLFAGNAPMNYTGRRESGWWYKGRDGRRELWSFSWAVSAALHSLLSKPRQQGLSARQVQTAGELSLGDVIVYDWKGDGRYQHSTIVTAFDALGMPLVNANTVSSRHRYWDYRDSYAWTESTRYGFFHIADEF